MYTKLLQQLKPQDVIIAVNNRLAIHLLEMLGQNGSAFPTPHIYSFKQYIEYLWRNNTTTTLLNDIQTHHIWKQILKNDDNLTINNTQACISLCEEAFDICQMWDINLDKYDYFITHEAKCFKAWQAAFLLYCQKHSCCTHSQALKHLIDNTHELGFSGTVTWVGFDTLTPRQMQWHTAINAHTKSSIFKVERQESKCLQYAAIDEADEIQVMVKWAIEQCKKHQKVACIIPDLSEKREAIIDAFRSYETGINGPLYNITAPKAIIANPMIESALHLISLSQQDIYVTEQLGPLLNTPYFSHNEHDQIWSSQLYETCHQDGLSQISRARLIQIIENIPSDEAHATAKEKWVKYFTQRKIDERMSPRQWSIFFSKQLANMGWPSNEKLDSLHFQSFTTFISLLEKLITLAQVAPSINFNQAIYYLSHLCHNTPFQAEGHNANIQVLGVLEAAVIPFDSAWVSGFSSQQWPMISAPNPFISIDLQRQLNTPHASLQREIFFNNQLFDSLRHVAPMVCFSYSKKINQAPSSGAHCIQKFFPLQFEIKKEPFFFDKNCLEYYDDKHARPYKEESIQGGTQVLQLQSNCPFQAFAKLRLKVHSPITLHDGINPAMRGQILHKILELFWKKNHSQQTLCQMSQEKIKEKIKKLSDQVIKNSYPSHIYPHLSTLLEIEKKRVIPLITAWLNYEKNRPKFTVIACEYKQKISINNLTITVKIDRIDQQPNGQELIIDYKTGSSNPNQWFQDPLQSVQLPVYSAFSSKKTQGIAFAEIRAQAIRFKGVCNNEAVVHKDIKTISNFHKDNWNDLNMEWKKKLKNVAYEFQIGNAGVEPLEPNKYCSHCQLFYLCRFNQC